MVDNTDTNRKGGAVHSAESKVGVTDKAYRIERNAGAGDGVGNELIHRVADGDEQAFEQLFERCRSKVYSIAFYLSKSPFAAEDISQEVFVSLWVSRKCLKKVESFDAYLYTIIYHKVLRYLKSETNQQQIMLWAVNAKSVSLNSTEESITEKEIKLLLGKAIEQLPPQKKLIYRLNKEHGLNYEEIGEQLQISPNTVKNHLVEAVKLIRRYFTHFTLQSVFLKLIENFY